MKPLRRQRGPIPTTPAPGWDLGLVVRNVGLALALAGFLALLAPILIAFGQAYGKGFGLW